VEKACSLLGDRLFLLFENIGEGGENAHFAICWKEVRKESKTDNGDMRQSSARLILRIEDCQWISSFREWQR
jgi:hypothetical protein